MARRFFKKLLPKPESLQGNRFLRLFGRVLHDRRLSHLNRHSVARGVGWGLFWGMVIMPGQTVGAVACCLLTGGNVPLAIAFTWISNPLTWIPVGYLGYRTGLLLTGMAPAENFAREFGKVSNMGLFQALGSLGSYFAHNLYIVGPMLLGGAVLGIPVGLAGFWGVRWFWRWNIVRRWRRRGHHLRCGNCRHLVIGDDSTPGVEKACPNCGAPIPVYRRIGLGIGALSRRLREGHAEVTP